MVQVASRDILPSSVLLYSPPCHAVLHINKPLLHFISSAKVILGSYREHPLLGQKCSPLLTFQLKCFRPCELTEEFSPLT